MTILRRDLLAGSALVLLGASGCGNGKQSCGNANPKALRTKFMHDFTAQFIGDPTKIKDPAPPPAADPWPDPEPTNPPSTSTRIWPKCGQSMTEIVADYVTFVNVLLTVGYVGPPPTTYPCVLLGDSIVQYLKTYPWPTGTDVPPEYQGELPTVYLVELAVIQDRLLQAINSFNLKCKGLGGGPSNWPPH